MAKIEDMARLHAILRGVPVKQDDPAWNCVTWMEEALNALAEDGQALGKGMADWGTVREKAMTYVAEKVDGHRFDGQAPEGTFDAGRVSTYCLLKGKEITA